MLKNILVRVIVLIILIHSQTNFAADKITILLDWFLNPGHAPLFVAQEKGFFKQQQLEVNLIGPADPSDPPKLVAAEKADIAITYEPQFMQQVAQGLPLAVIGTLINKPLNCLAVLKSSPILTIKDLKHKRIGHSTSGVNSIMLQSMLEKNHLTVKDVELINAHYGLSQALLTHQVDAASGMFRNFEVIQMELNHQPVRVFYPEQNGVPTYAELIFVVNKKHLADSRWARFLLAVKQGNAYLQQHPEEMWLAFAKAHPELNDKLNHAAWFATLGYFSKEPAGINTKEWEEFKKYMEKNNLMKI